MKTFLKIFKIVFGIISDFCFVFVLIYGIFFIPLIVGYHPMVMDGVSKEVSYDEGSLLYYKKAATYEIKRNDVIVYKPGSEYILHKVNKVVHEEDKTIVPEEKDDEEEETTKEKIYYLTNRDAYSKTTPNKIAYEDVVGKVGDVTVPYIGYYIEFVMNHMTLLYVAIAIVLIGLVLGLFIKDEKKEKK